MNIADLKNSTLCIVHLIFSNVAMFYTLYKIIGYEPTDLTVHTSPSRTAEGV